MNCDPGHLAIVAAVITEKHKSSTLLLLLPYFHHSSIQELRRLYELCNIRFWVYAPNKMYEAGGDRLLAQLSHPSTLLRLSPRRPER
jgi:hypothetical protein